MTYGDAQWEVLRISSGLHRKFGLKLNARVGLLGDASAEWLLCDLALMRCGADTVCLTAPGRRSKIETQPTNDEDMVQAKMNSLSASVMSIPDGNHLFSGLELQLLLCSTDWLEYFIEASPEEIPRCPIVTFTPAHPRLAAMAHHCGLQVFDLEFIAHFGEVAGWVPYIGVGGFEVFTTMYRSRSGSKSELAGVSVSLRGLALSAHSVREALVLRSDDVHFSYAWPAFAAERVVLHAVLAAGGSVGFFGGVRSPQIFDDIRRLQPTFLLGAPSLFRRQITRLRQKHVGWLGSLSFYLYRWALRHVMLLEEADCGVPESNTWLSKFKEGLARRCLQKPFSWWLAKPFMNARSALLGSRTRLRFVLTLCTVGSTALPPERCLWMRLLLGCPVLKGFVAVEAGGIVTLGEAPYFGEVAAEAFAVGRELPEVIFELLPLKIPIDDPDILGSAKAGIRLGTLQIRGPEGSGEKRVGVVCGRRGQELFVFGRLVSLQASRGNKGALCEALEQLLIQVAGPWLLQLMLVARDEGVVGIAAVRLEEVWRLARQCGIKGVSSGEDLCKDPRVVKLCLRELQISALRNKFSEAEMPLALHLQAAPFSFEAGLSSPTFQLRRDQLLPLFASTIEELFASTANGSDDEDDFLEGVPKVSGHKLRSTETF